MKSAFILLLTAMLLLMAHSSLAQCPSSSNQNLILTEGMGEVTGQKRFGQDLFSRCHRRTKFGTG